MSCERQRSMLHVRACAVMVFVAFVCVSAHIALIEDITRAHSCAYIHRSMLRVRAWVCALDGEHNAEKYAHA